MEITIDTAPRTFKFGQLQEGQEITRAVTFRRDDVDAFIQLTSDRARIHHDPEFAAKQGFGAPIVHGHLAVSPFSGMIGMHLPGEGCLIRNQQFQFRHAIFCGEPLVYKLAVERLRPNFKVVELSMEVRGLRGLLISGQCQCLLDFPPANETPNLP